jgi:hypothetical protein
MRALLAITLVSGVLAAPAFAQMSAGDMSCADFGAMDSSGQMAAAGAMGSMESGAMASGGMMSADTTSGSSAGNMAPNIQTITTACDGHPDMMVRDAMKEAPHG